MAATALPFLSPPVYIWKLLAARSVLADEAADGDQSAANRVTKLRPFLDLDIWRTVRRRIERAGLDSLTSNNGSEALDEFLSKDSPGHPEGVGWPKTAGPGA